VYFVRFVQRHDKKGEFKQQENGRKSGKKRFAGENRPFRRQKNPAGGFLTARAGKIGGLGRENGRFYALQAA
jgi:hypothetical protein